MEALEDLRCGLERAAKTLANARAVGFRTIGETRNLNSPGSQIKAMRYMEKFILGWVRDNVPEPAIAQWASRHI